MRNLFVSIIIALAILVNFSSPALAKSGDTAGVGAGSDGSEAGGDPCGDPAEDSTNG